jgi:lysophospholipase L1-like esterase
MAALALSALTFAAGSVWAATINGTTRNDTLRGGARADKISGKAGNDKLYGAGGNDVLVGGAGNDLLVGGVGADVLRCGPGRDTAVRDVPDKVASDCEVVRGPRPVPPAPPSPPPPAVGLYVAVGDSIAVGVGASNPSNGFVAVYFARMRANGLVQELSNLAVSGATTGTVLASQLPSALAEIARPSDAKVISVTVGANDSAATACRPVTAPSCAFGANLRLILERLQGALAEDPGEEQIQVMDRYNFAAGTSLEPFVAVDLLGTDGRANCGDTGWNDVIYCVALEKDAAFVDSYTPMLAGSRTYLADDIHPNDAGHAVLAQAFERARRAVADRPLQSGFSVPPN